MARLTRRKALKLSGVGMAGVTLGAWAGRPVGALAGEPKGSVGGGYEDNNSFFGRLRPYFPGKEPLAKDQMRITFLGTWYFPRLSQACNSVFVELGNGDAFVFECGTGVMAKYTAMGIPLGRMNKIFLTHLHADHMSDLTHIYSFGPAYDRRSPLYVWGPARSEVESPRGSNVFYEDGTVASCARLREAMRWHTESFGFQGTELVGFVPPPWDPGGHRDAYDLVAFDLPWREEEMTPAYDHGGVVITHFPSVHARQGSVSFKLTWNGLSMIYTGDTRPNNYVVRAANRCPGGVDVLIHEMTPPAEDWTRLIVGLAEDDPYYPAALASNRRVIDSSHTEQKAFGYVLGQLNDRPRLAVGTHFPATDDTIRAALADIRCWYPEGEVTVAADLMTLLVSRSGIEQRRAVVSDYAYPVIPRETLAMSLVKPRYNDGKTGDPTAQLDPNADVIPPSVYNARTCG